MKRFAVRVFTYALCVIMIAQLSSALIVQFHSKQIQFNEEDNPSTIFVFRFAQHHLAFVISRKGPSSPKNIAGPVDVIRLQGEAIVTDAIQALDGSGLPPGYGD